MSDELRKALWELDEATRFVSNKRRALKLALLKHDPHCHWCGVDVYDLKDTPRNIESPPQMATVDHTITRFERRKGDRVLKVLACYTCNQRRAREDEARFLNETT